MNSVSRDDGRPAIVMTDLHDDNGEPLQVPLYNLAPTIVPAEEATEKIPCSDWKGCAISCGALMAAAAYGLVCGVVGYRIHECNTGSSNASGL